MIRKFFLAAFAVLLLPIAMDSARASGQSQVTTWSFVDVGAGFSCGIDSSSNAQCWGMGDGRTALPGGSLYPRPIPRPDGETGWRDISGGNDHGCGVSTSSNLYCWGAGGIGQRGDGTYHHASSPTPVVLPAGETGFVEVEAGWAVSCAIATSANAYCWGSGYQGQLGNGDTADSAVPVKVILPQAESGWRGISVLRTHTCAVALSHNLYCWGYGADGNLGNGSTERSLLPQHIAAPAGESGWSTVTVGMSHSCGITTSGAAHCWGRGVEGQRGNGDESTALTPEAVLTPQMESGWISIRAGSDFTCGVAASNRGYCWGRDAFGRLGTGRSGIQAVPTEVAPASNGEKWKEIRPFEAHTCGVTTSGKAYCWGFNSSGEIGDGTYENRNLPTAVKELPPPPTRKVNANPADAAQSACEFRNWSKRTHSAAFADEYWSSQEPGECWRVEFVGRTASVWATKDRFSGVASISIDDVEVARVDLYASDVHYDTEIFRWLGGDGPHVLTVTVTGERDPRARFAFVQLDAFSVPGNPEPSPGPSVTPRPTSSPKPTFTPDPPSVRKFNAVPGQNGQEACQESQWARRTSAGAYQGDYWTSRHRGDCFDLNFSGDTVRLWAVRDRFGGVADVYLDGQKVAEVSLYSYETEFDVNVFSWKGTAGRHTLKVEVTGDKDPRARMPFVALDAFSVGSTQR